MKFIPEEVTGKRHVLELTRRNLGILSDLASGERLIAPGQLIEVRVVDDEMHYADRQPGPIEIGGVLI